MRILTISAVLLFGTIFLQSCGGVKPGTQKSGGNYYETFYVGEQGTQYFIKPFTFEGSSGKLVMDLTWRYKDQIKDSTTFTFSIYHKDAFRTLDAMTISNGTKDFSLRSFNLIFIEKAGDAVISRFSAKIPVADTKELFLTPEWKVKVSPPARTLEYLPSSKAKRIISKVGDNIFSIF